MDKDVMFEKLYEDSAFTFEGLRVDDWQEVKNQINELLSKEGIGKVPDENFFKYDGWDMNQKYQLTGSNRYSNDLTFVSFLLDGLDIGKLSMLKIRIGARWFDDIVDNNAYREGR